MREREAQKLAVKSWNSQLQNGGRAGRPAERVACDEDKTLNAPVASDTTGCIQLSLPGRSSESKSCARASTRMAARGNDLYGSADGSDEDSAWRAPQTVGQVKHAYRVRARREESKIEEKARAHAIRQQQERLIRCKSHSKVSCGDLTYAGVVGSQVHDEPEDQIAPCDEDSHASTKFYSLTDLDPSGIQRDTGFRNDVLRNIRRELSAGRPVLLRNDMRVMSADVSVGDVKLMMQQLCSLSLLFCARGQDPLPIVNNGERSGQVISLLLQPRIPNSVSQEAGQPF